jgi:hypothetical protein
MWFTCSHLPLCRLGLAACLRVVGVGGMVERMSCRQASHNMNSNEIVQMRCALFNTVLCSSVTNDDFAVPGFPESSSVWSLPEIRMQCAAWGADSCVASQSVIPATAKEVHK